MAGKSEKSKSPAKRGRPAAPVVFEAKTARKKKVQDLFQDRASADVWLRQRLSRQVSDYDFLIDQLRLDLKANTRAAQLLMKDKKPVTSELMRARQSILTSMRTLMGGQQELMISLMKSRNLLGDLGGEDEGGDVIIQVQRLPPDEPGTETTDGGTG